MLLSHTQTHDHIRKTNDRNRLRSHNVNVVAFQSSPMQTYNTRPDNIAIFTP